MNRETPIFKKVKKSSLIPNEVVKIFEEEYHSTLVINENEDVIYAQKTVSGINRITLFYLSKKELTKSYLETILISISHKKINTWDCATYGDKNIYQRVEIYY